MSCSPQNWKGKILELYMYCLYRESFPTLTTSLLYVGVRLGSSQVKSLDFKIDSKRILNGLAKNVAGISLHAENVDNYFTAQ